METETILLDFLERNDSSSQKKKIQISTWEERIKVLYSLGISMEETLNFLHQNKPEKETFLTWISNRTRIQPEINTNTIDTVLSKEDLELWEQNGYIVLRNAVDEVDCKDACEAIWNYLNATIDNPSSWYQQHPGKRGMMLQFSDHPVLDRIRQSVKIKKAYEHLYGHSDIYKTIDKVGFNPPEIENYRFSGSPLHWDASLKLPIPYKLQGLLYLTDCNEHEGAFHCVPGFHHQMHDWLQTNPKSDNPRDEAPKQLKSTPITGKAGDFIIWNQALPHCATPNHGTFPRMTQYLTYLPNNLQDQEEWI